MKDGVPVGVLRQLSPKPNVRYSVLGLARIIGKAAGYYLLEGMPAISPEVQMTDQGIVYTPVERKTGLVKEGLEIDMRILRLRSVVQRQGQASFREHLMEIYERKCAVSSCDVEDVLEAAHVLPYRGPHTNDVSNGIILRADFHILFDEGLLAVDPESLSVQLAPVIRSNKHYANFEGIRLHAGSRRIDRDVLAAHKHYCGF